jgi:hypothetical protein
VDEESRLSIEHFVRGELGCQCPPEVFSSIRVVDHPKGFTGLPVLTSAEIGRRLLVVVCCGFTEVARHLGLLVRAGITACESGGLQRLRLVVPIDEGVTWESPESELAALAGPDEQVHLHVVPRDRTPGILLAGGKA